ncbi:hypothetical protein [Siphonobacter aquaeclarae]|nr:hypothetical protein [Siphonobacter aquaeclarae]
MKSTHGGYHTLQVTHYRMYIHRQGNLRRINSDISCHYSRLLFEHLFDGGGLLGGLQSM